VPEVPKYKSLKKALEIRVGGGQGEPEWPQAASLLCALCLVPCALEHIR
jgi:hypothetical protein